MDPSSEATPAAEPSAAPTETPATPPPETPIGDQPPAEKPAETPAAEPAQDPKLAKGFAALARKERELRAREERVKAADPELAQLRQLRELARTDPTKVLDAYGVTYEQVTDAILNQGEPPKPEDRVKALEERLTAREQAEAKAREAAEAEQGKTIVRDWVGKNADKYEHVKAYGQEAADEVFALFAMRLNEGKPISLEDAARHIEKAIEEKAKPLLALKRYAPSGAPSNGKAAEAKSGSTTLTNRSASEAPPGGEAPLPLDPDERDRLLNEQFRGRIWT